MGSQGQTNNNCQNDDEGLVLKDRIDLEILDTVRSFVKIVG